MDNLIPINIIIADRSYRIKTLPKDEEVIRKTVKEINDKLIEFKTQFAGKDMQDYIAMVIIWYATLASARQQEAVLPDNFLDSLKIMEEQIDQLITTG